MKNNQRCPLSGMGAKLSWNSFASACMARQDLGLTFDTCKLCTIGKKIKAGRKTKPPEGIKIIFPTDWTPEPIIRRKERKFQKWLSIGRPLVWPFAVMNVAEIFEGKRVDKERIRSAARQVAGRSGKQFKNWVEGDSIFVERII